MNRLKHILITIAVVTGISALTVLIMDKIVMPAFVYYGGEVTVPNVLNTDYQQALKILEKYGFTVIARERFDRTLPNNTVLYQSPEGGSVVKKGRLIRLIISRDELSVSVPDLQLSTLRDAQFTLESSGLKLGEVFQEPSADYPQGIVIRQSVNPNEKIPSGTAVNVTVSSGKPLTNVRVPYLISKSLMDAKKIIVENNLKLGMLTKKFSADLLPGTIMAQSPDSAAMVMPMSPVDLVISSTNPDDE